MDALITSIINRFLHRFVKSAEDGQAAPSLRASLSSGGVQLHNLELDLDSVVKGLPVDVQRAFAKQLSVKVSWAALGSQPIQVCKANLLGLQFLSLKCYRKSLRHRCRSTLTLSRSGLPSRREQWL